MDQRVIDQGAGPHPTARGDHLTPGQLHRSQRLDTPLRSFLAPRLLDQRGDSG